MVSLEATKMGQECQGAEPFVGQSLQKLRGVAQDLG